MATYLINNVVTTLFSEQSFGWKPILLVTRGNALGSWWASSYWLEANAFHLI
ncbi:MAG: hypothetical protein MJZ33_02175 [Paludibacteraceae bacterium]|nr:hypothetical protein [Paludibacteraceae bacterium]